MKSHSKFVCLYLHIHISISAYSLQEINSQPHNAVKGLFKDDPWTEKFKELLVQRDYVGIKCEQMQGLLLNVFAKRDYLLHIRDVESEYTRTGLGGMWVSVIFFKFF